MGIITNNNFIIIIIISPRSNLEIGFLFTHLNYYSSLSTNTIIILEMRGIFNPICCPKGKGGKESYSLFRFHESKHLNHFPSP